MSKLADQLREIKVFNNWELLRQFAHSHDEVAIEYQTSSNWHVHCTRIWTCFKNPKLNIPRNHLNPVTEKEFVGKRSESWPKALEWANQNMKGPFVVSPLGGWISKSVLDRAKQTILMMKENA